MLALCVFDELYNLGAGEAARASSQRNFDFASLHVREHSMVQLRGCTDMNVVGTQTRTCTGTRMSNLANITISVSIIICISMQV